jgi:hypothetical protein
MVRIFFLAVKLESELYQNPSDLRTLFYIYLMSYSMDRSFKTADFRMEKMFMNVSLNRESLMRFWYPFFYLIR